MGEASDGSITGLIWQTGVMRKDFELFGDVLFLDKLGRSLKNRGWATMTVAMVDGDKKLCFPCDSLTMIEESIPAYQWLLRMTVEMTPGMELTDTKVIFGDGIFFRGDSAVGTWHVGNLPHHSRSPSFAQRGHWSLG